MDRFEHPLPTICTSIIRSELHVFWWKNNYFKTILTCVFRKTTKKWKVEITPFKNRFSKGFTATNGSGIYTFFTNFLIQIVCLRTTSVCPVESQRCDDSVISAQNHLFSEEILGHQARGFHLSEIFTRRIWFVGQIDPDPGGGVLESIHINIE